MASGEKTAEAWPRVAPTRTRPGQGRRSRCQEHDGPRRYLDRSRSRMGCVKYSQAAPQGDVAGSRNHDLERHMSVWTHRLVVRARSEEMERDRPLPGDVERHWT